MVKLNGLKQSISLLASVLTLMFASSSYAQCQRIEASGNAQYPPYLWREPSDPSQLTGAIAFLMEDIAEEVGIPINLAYRGPWGRVQLEVAEGRVDMIAGAFFTYPRTEYMDYIYPQFQGTRTAVFVRDDHPIKFSAWQDLKPYVGITVVNNSFGQAFDEYAKAHLNIQEVSSLNQGLGMVSLGRIDYLIYEENPALAYARKQGITNLERLEKIVTSQNLFLTLSKRSDCNRAAIKEKFSLALQKLTAERRMEGYLQRSLDLWQRQGNAQ